MQRDIVPGKQWRLPTVLVAMLVAGCLDTSMPKAPGEDVAAVTEVSPETTDGRGSELLHDCLGACGDSGDEIGCDGAGCAADACASEGGCCMPEAGKECFGDAVHWVDSCGGKGEEIAVCKNGCKDGQCMDCTADCAGKECGPDGCGGDCGKCDDKLSCTEDTCDAGTCKSTLTSGCTIGGACVEPGTKKSGDPCQACVPEKSVQEWTTLGDGTSCGDFAVCQAGKCECALLACGAGCCEEGQVCHGGECCAPDCDGKVCGDDDCGGGCGECQDLEACVEGMCECQFAPCAGGCCQGGEVCAGSQCCMPQCEGKECGPDGCGGVCGACAPGQVCLTGICPAEGKECIDGNETPWDGCTDGMLSEFLVPQSVAGDQDAGAAVFLADGAFVVAWRDTGMDSGQGDVLIRRFLSDGTPGSVVSSNAPGMAGFQVDPQVGALAGGNVVVTWESCPESGMPETAQDSSGCGVYARRFNPGLAPLQSEFKVNSTTLDQQRNPAVATLASGSFIVVWESCPAAGQPEAGQDGSGCGVVGQLFTTDGQPTLGEFVVPAYTTGDQFAPATTALGDGGFVVVWQGAGDGDAAGVFGRVYNPQGVPGEKQFTLSDKVSNTQEGPVVTQTADGFVAAWESWGQDGDGYGVFGQLFAANGAKLGAEVAWSLTTSGNQRFPRLARIPGGIAAGWSDWGLDGDGGAVVLRTFDVAAKPTGKEILANEYTAGNQMLTAVASAPNGTILMVWAGMGPEGAGSGVYARRFGPDGKPLYH